MRPKLQAKMQSMQTEITDKNREIADLQQVKSVNENRLVDSQEQLELATLDKEMAEERAETAEGDLEEIREKMAVLEVELQVLREGASMLLRRFALDTVTHVSC